MPPDTAGTLRRLQDASFRNTTANTAGTTHRMSLDDFDLLQKLGSGTFGRVMLAKKKADNELYAIKFISKDKLLRLGPAAVQHVLDENRILKKMEHPFVLTLHYSFQDGKRLYFVTNWVGGGDMLEHLERFGSFSEPWAAFYSGQLLLAIAYLHDHGIVYRDLKPENVLLGMDGYLVLCDFGLAKQVAAGKLSSGNKDSLKALPVDAEEAEEEEAGRSRLKLLKVAVAPAQTFCGTPLYLAPEVVARRPYGRSVDWWTYGCIVCELLTGSPPFLAADMIQLLDLIRAGKMMVKNEAALQPATLDFVRGLLRLDPTARYGCGEGGVDRLVAHAFFAEIDFGDLFAKALTPPFVPAEKLLRGSLGMSPQQPSQTATELFDEAFESFTKEEEEEEDLGGDDLDDDDDDDHHHPGTRLPGGLAGFAHTLVSTCSSVGFRLKSFSGGGDATERATPRGTTTTTTATATATTTATPRGGGADELATSALLCDAAKSGNLGALKVYLRLGAGVNHADYDGRTALHVAASEGHYAACKLLLDRGATFDGVDRWGNCALDDAIREDHARVVKLLGARGAVPKQSNDASSEKKKKPCEFEDKEEKEEKRRGADADDDKVLLSYPRSPQTATISLEMHAERKPTSAALLCDAALIADLAAAQSLLDKGVDVNCANYDRRTPLHVAASEGHADMIRFLLDAGADARLRDRWGNCALDDAIREDKVHAKRVLLAACASSSGGGASSAVPSSPQTTAAAAEEGPATTPPLLARRDDARIAAALCDHARFNDLEALDRALEEGADVDGGDYDGRTALHLAAAEGHAAMVDYLLQHRGADHRIRDRWGHTALDEAKRGRHRAVLGALRAHAKRAVRGTTSPKSNRALPIAVSFRLFSAASSSSSSSKGSLVRIAPRSPQEKTTTTTTEKKSTGPSRDEAHESKSGDKAEGGDPAPWSRSCAATDGSSSPGAAALSSTCSVS